MGILVMAVGAPLSAADIEAGRRKAESCASCHGVDGNATRSGIPSLAGQPTIFTHWQLIKYRDGRRKDPEMSPAAAHLTDQDMADLAAYYAAQRPRSRASQVDARMVDDGQKAAAYYHCTSCHRKDLSGQEQVPRLAGQDIDYLRKLLRAFKERRATDLDGMMTMSAQPISEDDIEILAHYLASLGGDK